MSGPSDAPIRAPAKLNLCLYLGPTRSDGLHELCSLFQPLQLADRLVVSETGQGSDEVVCAAIEGPNLAVAALAELRAAGWQAPALRVEIEKRIPVAAGLGGGSADAAAVLRLAAGEIDPEALRRIAIGLGADVPSQLEPAFALVGGAGELVKPLPGSSGWGVVLIPDERGLSTADVYAEADRLGLARGPGELTRAREQLLEAAAGGASPLDYDEMLVNDLGEAAISLRPAIAETLDDLRGAGAEHALVTGSGPTTVGLFADPAAAERAAAALASRYSASILTAPIESPA